MKLREINATDLSRISKVPQTTILDIKNGIRKNITIDTLQKLSASLRVSPVYFLEETAVGSTDLDDKLKFLPNDKNKLFRGAVLANRVGNYKLGNLYLVKL
jgi:transcriptional regulator with XRE-family HTH domain